jgi:hypothetical protein
MALTIVLRLKTWDKNDEAAGREKFNGGSPRKKV